MNIEKYVMVFAGFMVFATSLLAWLFSPLWLLFTGFVGVNLLQAAFTGFCPLAILLRKLNIKSGSVFDR